MKPYREIEKHHPGKLSLLPHAAADTEHISRVEGAKQAVDQLLRAIRHHEVINLKGDLPSGYANAGSKTVCGVGKVTQKQLCSSVAEPELTKKMRQMAEGLAATWAALDAIADPQRRSELIERYGEQLILDSNRYCSLMGKLGLKGPYVG